MIFVRTQVAKGGRVTETKIIRLWRIRNKIKNHMEQEPKQSNDIDQNIAADWEGAEDIEQELQTKIKSNMEQLPKTEHEQEPKIEKSRGEIAQDAMQKLANLVSWIDVLKNNPEDSRNQEMVDNLIKQIERNLQELKK
ncbi:MAG: hypothetical protein HY505_02100 [Candidatus Yanofskybacteria bacterium]|nr:hypothetical protein [Candidatus Yanofskybacteria bacterium]